MTKRDVAVWFCKVVALGGMLNAAFNLLGGLIGWKFFGVSNPFPLWGVLTFGFYGFMWLFARGIGSEIAAEGEHGEPITSSSELGGLLLRCVGLSLLLSGALIFASSILFMAVGYFSSRTIPPYMRIDWPNIGSGFVQAALGFFLAFGPRLRAALQPK